MERLQEARNLCSLMALVVTVIAYAKGQAKMDKIKNLLLDYEIQSDELGRTIVGDARMLEKINGAISSCPEFMVPDTACGNGNCVC